MRIYNQQEGIGSPAIELATKDSTLLIDPGLRLDICREILLVGDFYAANPAPYLRQHGIIPDYSAIPDAIVCTHGHVDHYGSFPAVPRNDFIFLYAPAFSSYIIHRAQTKWRRWHETLSPLGVYIQSIGRELRLSDLHVQTYHVDHTIPDAVALKIETPEGVVVYTGDFRGPLPEPLLDERAELLLIEGTNVGQPNVRPIEACLEECVRNLALRSGSIVIFIDDTNAQRALNLTQVLSEAGLNVYMTERLHETVATYCALLGKTVRVGVFDPKEEMPEKCTECAILSEFFPSAYSEGRFLITHHMDLFRQRRPKVIVAQNILGFEREFQKLRRQLRSLGIEVEHMHPSGHASSNEIFAAINSIKPKSGVLPLHTSSVEYFEQMLERSGIRCLRVKRKEKLCI